MTVAKRVFIIRPVSALTKPSVTDDSRYVQRLRLFTLATIVLAFTHCGGGGGASAAAPGAAAPAAISNAARWIPSPSDTLQWQLSGAFDPTVAATVYDVDAFETPAATVSALHASGRHAVCYVNAGAFETGRPDASSFPAALIGAAYAGWPGEFWLDVRRLDLLGPIMDARLDLCKSKGFDAVEPDNIDGYQNATGFPLQANDQIAYNTWIAQHAHARGMAVALKNDGDQAAALLTSFDFVLAEDCWQQSQCSAYAPFVAGGKPVFTVEYTDHWTDAAFHQTVCPKAAAASMTAVLKNRALDAWRDVCP